MCSTINICYETINWAFLIQSRWMLNSISTFHNNILFVWTNKLALYIISIIPSLIVCDVPVAIKRWILSCEGYVRVPCVDRLWEQISLGFSDIWFIKHNYRINTRITTCHSVSLPQTIQEWIFITKQQLPYTSLLCEPTKSNLYSYESDEIL